MATDIVSQDSEATNEDITGLWPLLSVQQKRVILEIAQEFAVLNTQEAVTDSAPALANGHHSAGQITQSQATEQGRLNEGAIALIDSWLAESANATPEELAEGQADLEEFKRALNENRAPLPPLFP